jgi:hypothetical protein
VILKLNGGMGTSMGLNFAKSLLPVKLGDTCLDLTAKQVCEGGSRMGLCRTFIGVWGWKRGGIHFGLFFLSAASAASSGRFLNDSTAAT